jgi:uncharacterized protein (TIGR01319 family)
MKDIISIDIGSTYTKGIILKEDHGSLNIQSRFQCPTAENLSESFLSVLNELCQKKISEKSDIPDNFEIYTSSSAKGGLAICAIGLVPELTLSIAKLIALSAGARIVSEYSFKLNEEHIADLVQQKPDIILFSGGTDGGNEKYLIHNARVLGESDIQSTILYCGNNALHSKIRSTLKHKNLIITENVMPLINEINSEAAHNAIGNIFMDTIIQGKGLGRINEITGKEPIPTPKAVIDLVDAMYSNEIMDSFALIDMGGATTDCYSCINGLPKNDSVILRGIEEPHITRSVEGDLGMRVTARATADSCKDYIEKLILKKGLSIDGFNSYITQISSCHEYLPKNKREKDYDNILAQSAVHYSIHRHSGFFQKTYTPSGKRYLQKGKDLREIKYIIGTGGYLSKNPSPLFDAMGPIFTDNGHEILVPENPQYLSDSNYIFPLLGNCAANYSEGAAMCAYNALDKVTIHVEDQ